MSIPKAEELISSWQTSSSQIVSRVVRLGLTFDFRGEVVSSSRESFTIMDSSHNKLYVALRAGAHFSFVGEKNLAIDFSDGTQILLHRDD